MMKRFEVERLLRAFGRKAHDHVVENYLEFIRDFNEKQVRKAVSFAIDKSEKVPVPADLRKFADIGSEPEKSMCSSCDDKGFVLVGAGAEFDQKGFRIIGHDLPLRCRCGATPPMLDKRWATRTEIQVWSIARLLAQSLAQRSVKSEMIKDVPHWREFWWTKEHIKTWVGLAKRVSGLPNLVRLSELIDGSDPDDCAECPEKLCTGLLPTAKSLKNEKGVVRVFQGLRL